MSETTRRRRHSPAVYRRRRLVVLLVAALVIGGLVWLFIAQPWRGAAETIAAPTPSSASPSPSTSPTPRPTGTGAPEADVEEETPETDVTPTAEGCLPGAITVEAVTDASSYNADQNPQLSIRLTNTSEAACTLNVGTSAQAFTIMSGSDVWWRSTDCQTEPSDMIVLLEAGQEVSSAAPLEWDRTRSSVDTCDGERPRATGGGATYHLSVSINGIASTNTASFQLG